jgi:hypothetical protein
MNRYIYIGMVVKPEVTIDSKKVIRLQNGAYYPYVTKPGHKRIQVVEPFNAYFSDLYQKDFYVDIKPGKTYFLKIETGFEMLVQFSEEDMKNEISTCSYADEADIFK